MNYIKLGAIYLYIANANIILFKITEILSENTFKGEVVAILNDDSGNGYFHYLKYKNKEYAGSIKYLHKIDIFREMGMYV